MRGVGLIESPARRNNAVVDVSRLICIAKVVVIESSIDLEMSIIVNVIFNDRFLGRSECEFVATSWDTEEFLLSLRAVYD